MKRLVVPGTVLSGPMGMSMPALQNNAQMQMNNPQVVQMQTQMQMGISFPSSISFWKVLHFK